MKLLKMLEETDKARRRISHIWARETHEHYVEEPWVSRALFNSWKFEGTIYDPACGFGHIMQSAWEADLDAYGSDIVDRGPALAHCGDFLKQQTLLTGNIVCNPPFDLIREFTETACRVAERDVAMIFPTRRLNAAGKWLGHLPLIRILYITPRPSMPPGHIYRDLEAQGKRPSGGTQDFAWLIFRRHFGGTPTVGWLLVHTR